MKRLSRYSFIVQICLCMFLSLLINVGFGLFLKLKLSQDNYTLSIDVLYNENSSLEFYFDTGSNFNQLQRKTIKVYRGFNSIKIPFELDDQEQLKSIRLDFGENAKLSKVKIDELKLYSGNEVLFKLESEVISSKIDFSKCIKKIEEGNGVFYIDKLTQPFDPYLVLSPLNELIYPLWLRILLLVFPWFCILSTPIYKWISQRINRGEISLLLISMFLVVIPLKTAWVTFMTLLMLAYSIFKYIQKKKVNFNSNLYLIAALFLPSLLFNNEQLSKLSIPIAFIIFPIICSLIDFSNVKQEIKKIYSKIFLVFASILLVSCILLLCLNGYFYNIEVSNFFLDLKSNRHQLLYWIFYNHTTFLSFFILIGQVFVMELQKEKRVSKNYLFFYTLFAVLSLLLMGSRFAIGIYIILIILSFVSCKHLSRILLPLWLTSLSLVIFFIEQIDSFRAELWKISWIKLREDFWFGHGTGSSSVILPKSLPIQKSGLSTVMKINHSHNQFLTYLLENGFIGALFVMVLLFLLFYRFGKEKNKTMMLILFTILMLSIIESPFKTATPVYVICFLLSVFSVKPFTAKYILREELSK